MHLISPPAQATIAGLSGRLSQPHRWGERMVAPPEWVGPVLTWAEARMWTIQVFSGPETQLWGQREAGRTFLSGYFSFVSTASLGRRAQPAPAGRCRGSDGCLGPGKQGYSKGGCYGCSGQPGALWAHLGMRQTPPTLPSVHRSEASPSSPNSPCVLTKSTLPSPVSTLSWEV